MIFIDLINGRLAIYWERYNRLRNSLPEPSHRYRVTHQAIASLDGSPSEKLKQLEKLLGGSCLYEVRQKDDKNCCRVIWQYRRGYGVANTEREAVTLAQVDLLSILSDNPIDLFRDNRTWDDFI